MFPYIILYFDLWEEKPKKKIPPRWTIKQSNSMTVIRMERTFNDPLDRLSYCPSLTISNYNLPLSSFLFSSSSFFLFILHSVWQ